MKSKYDLKSLKAEFLKSKHTEVKWFLRDKWVNYDSRRATRTKWRSKEKQAYDEKMLNRAIEKSIEKWADQLEIPVEALKEAKVKFLWKIMEMWDMEKLSMKDLALWLEKIKTELGEPEHVSANYNMNANKVEWLTEEESEALDVIFSQKVRKPKKSTD